MKPSSLLNRNNKGGVIETEWKPGGPAIVRAMSERGASTSFFYKLAWTKKIEIEVKLKMATENKKHLSILLSEDISYWMVIK